MQDLNISLIQASLAWEQPEANRKNFEGFIRTLGAGQDIIILPEMFTTGFTMRAEENFESMDGRTIQWMQDLSQKTGAAITGSLIIKEGDSYHNRLIWVQPDGFLGYYDKRHPFSFLGEDAVFTPGQTHLITSWKGWRICPLICYDLRFPAWCRYPEGVDLMIFVANWPEIRAYHWSQLLKARAIENLAYVAGLNRTGKDAQGVNHSGDSAIIDFKGNVIQEITGKEGILSYSCSWEALQEYRTRFPFLNDRDHFKFIT